MLKVTKTILVLLTVGLMACSPTTNTQTSETGQSAAAQEPLVEEVLTKKQQEALTPDAVIDILQRGNERFMVNDLTQRSHNDQVLKSAHAQYPKAIVLSCVDSRIPVEDVFDRGIGDMFVARVAGNFVNKDILGSMEFATKVSGSKLVVVLGHEDCGAVKAAVDNVELGNITDMIKNIRPAVDAVDYDGARDSSNHEFVHLVAESNIARTVAQIRERSPIMADMEKNGEIKIVGAVYNMSLGQITWLNM